MNILCLDTSGEKIAIGLVKGKERHTFISEEGSKKHNSSLLGFVEAFLEKNELDISDIDYFGVVVGPGSFTGIRVGVATINAFALALSKPVIEIVSLEQLFEKDDIMVCLDCKHSNYYCGLKEGKDIKYLALSANEIADYDIKKIELIDVQPERLIDKVLEKIVNKEFSKQAKPFYLKKSSAEREAEAKC